MKVPQIRVSYWFNEEIGKLQFFITQVNRDGKEQSINSSSYYVMLFLLYLGEQIMPYKRKGMFHVYFCMVEIKRHRTFDVYRDSEKAANAVMKYILKIYAKHAEQHKKSVATSD